MITETDSFSTVELEKYFVILPAIPFKFTQDEFIQAFNGRRVASGFKYNSQTNDSWLNPEQLRELIRLHVDPNFTV